jgi:hypothetical protein
MDPDPSLAQSMGDLVTRDLPRLVRRVDVPGRVEAGMEVAADAIRAAAEQVPGRRHRAWWRPWAPVLAITAVVALVAVTGWWMARSSALATARDSDREFDEDALDRATDEGMPDDATLRPVSNAVPAGAAR